MRIVLQSVEDGRYYGGFRKWTDDVRAAYQFPHITDAIQRCVAEHLTRIRVILKFEVSAYDIEVPLFMTSATPAPAVAFQPPATSRTLGRLE